MVTLTASGATSLNSDGLIVLARLARVGRSDTTVDFPWERFLGGITYK